MSEIVIYQSGNNQIEVSVQFENETVWLSQKQMAELFQRDRTVITRHIANVFKEGELDKNVVSAKFALTTQHGAIKGKEQLSETECYNLDLIISVGYRVKSPQGVKFRQWANRILKDYLIQGYAINQKRLQQKQQEVEFLKTGLRIVSRALENTANEQEQESISSVCQRLGFVGRLRPRSLRPKRVNTKRNHLSYF